MGAAWAALSGPAEAQDWRALYLRGYEAAPEWAPPASAPVELGVDRVPIVIAGGRARVRVSFGGGRALATMVIDTGASVMSVSATLAKAMLDRGLAVRAGEIEIAQADGTIGMKDRIIIKSVKVGDRSIGAVEAIINPDGVEMLLPFGVLAGGGRFTIDVRAGLLIFGGG